MKEQDEQLYFNPAKNLDTPAMDKVIQDSEDDYEFARNHIKQMIVASQEAVEAMNNLALDAEHPRAFEVLGNLIKQNSEMNKDLMALQKQRKSIFDVKGNSNEGGTVNNNALFIGSTTDLQKFLLGKNKESTEEITIDEEISS